MSKILRIVQASGWYHPDSVGGTEVYVSRLVRHLRADGHDVAVAAPAPGADAPYSYDYENCEVFRYPIPSAPTRDEAQGDIAVRGSEYLHRWLLDRRADVVHMHTFVTGLGLAEIAAARRAGSRVVVTTHSSSLGFTCQRGTLMWHGRTLCDGIVDEQRCAACELQHRGAGRLTAGALSRIPAGMSGVARSLPGRLGTALGMTDLIARNRRRQRDMLDAADAFVVLTRRAADIVVANGAPPGKVVVNRLGVGDAPVRQPPPAPASRSVIRVGYVGRFDEVKGVNDLTEAWRRLPRSLPLRLEFRGPAQTGRDRATLAAIAERLAGDSRVTFADACAPEEMFDVLRAYDLLCCPSRCLEGGPTVGLEALAAGVPVIAATVGGLAEVLEDGVNGRLVPPGDVERLAAALAEIAHDPDGTIRQWRRRLPAPRTMREVADDYLAVYGTAGLAAHSAIAASCDSMAEA